MGRYLIIYRQSFEWKFEKSLRKILKKVELQFVFLQTCAFSNAVSYYEKLSVHMGVPERFVPKQSLTPRRLKGFLDSIWH